MTSQGSFGLRQLRGQSPWESHTLSSRLSRVGRGCVEAPMACRCECHSSTCRVSEGTRRGSHGVGGASGGQPVGRAAGSGGRGPAGSGEGRDAPAGVRRHLGRVGPSPALRPKRRRAPACMHASRRGGRGRKKNPRSSRPPCPRPRPIC